MPPMKYISPMIQVGYVFQQNLVLKYVDDYSDDGTAGCDHTHSVRLVRAMVLRH